MDPALNPFKPGSGLRPPALEGRTRQREEFDLLVARSKNRNYDRGMILSGLRGVGKTTLLNNLSEHAERQGWLTIGLEARPNESGVSAVRAKLGSELAAGLRRFSRKHQMQKALDDLISLARGFTLGVGLGPAKVEVSLDHGAASGDIDLDLEELVEAISAAMKKKGTAFGLFIDEMQDLDSDLLGALLSVQHRASQREWPFFVIGAGLPNLPSVLADNRSYAERQFAYSTIGPLAPADAAEALEIPVNQHGGSFTPDALSILVEASGGYPYFLQEYGKAVWNVAATAVFDEDDAHLAVEEGRRALDEGFFPSRWNRPSDRERRYMRAIALAADDAPRSGVVAAAMGQTTTGVSDVRDSLIRKGLIWSPEHGRIAFTVPGMSDFIRRQPID
ncbi:ATP-binding protein [Rhodococcus sp. NPDC079359]|uniref:ATP-binding protein n=1 Tax=Nocardiaceae TaxID=85025 RepID=UPI000B9AF18E|nr:MULTISPECIES: ATP-binding protein [unclassified Rhodococcus (in: high G+C Gram-positive bacteria)]OZE37237.1 ATP-binding protein [Rhodococcus sp. 05-2254-4]OZE45100.1 ATP-binding protein [Rhodococcus sp. 05-2254-3]OZE45363.1 ATP-binding protein [Rhodococcus sp. 05-2254-2]